MMSTWMRRGAAGLLAATALVLAACGGGDSDAPTLGTITGTVVTSADSAPVANATVSVGARSVVTAADGAYTLTDVPAADRAVLRVSATGYVDALVTTPVTAGKSVPTSARLLREAATQTFDAAAAAVLTTAGSAAREELPAASLVNAATGAAVSGNVVASVTPLNPAADPQTMPGDYSVSATERIESFGAIKVNLRDAAGNQLNLKAGSTATIRIPLSSRSATPPATIPLYWFNETTGLWVKEGSATLAGTATNRYYEGQVTHFTYWNADMPQDTIYVHGCVADTAGVRQPYALVRTSGIDYSGSSSDMTNEQGEFIVPIRKDGSANLWAELQGKYSNTVVVGPSSVDIYLTTCLVIANGLVAPVIVEQPQGNDVVAGGYVSFLVVATGTEPMTYQWRFNGVNLAGQTYPWLAIDGVGAANAGTYTVVVRNEAGSVTSVGAVLTVGAPVAPTITLPPQATSVVAGNTAIFSVTATGTPTLTYQWLRNGTAIAGATGPNYTLATALADNGARFSVRVTNAQGAVTSAAALLTVTAPVLTAPTIGTQPLDITTQAGNTVTFSVTASGTPTPTYQWRRNGTAIAGATSASYTTPALIVADSGAIYSVVVSNSQGSVTSRNAVLTVTANTSSDAKAQLMRLMGLSMDFFEAASVPMQLISDAGAFLAPSAVCSSGGIAGSLNGGALPAAGTPVPTSATLAATANACADGNGTVYTGTSSVAYSLTSLEPSVGTASATVNAMRARDVSGTSVTRDVTASGTASVVLAGSVSGGVTSQSMALTLGSGATLRNELSGLTATFASGSVTVATDEVTATQAPQRSRVTFGNLSFSVAGVSYVATGFYEVTFATQGGYSGGSGEAVLSSGGVRVGRIYANASGIFIEVDGVSQPFAVRQRALAR